MALRDATEGLHIEYLGPDDRDLGIYEGHVGLVLDAVLAGEVTAALVNGPTLCLSLDVVAAVDSELYLARGDRLAANVHPLRDEPVPSFWRPGEEWPEGARPSRP